jgi:RHS repeat-associated protein
MRRRIRKEFTWQSSAWVQTNEVRYLYDGSLVVQERDGNNLPLVTLTRQGLRLLARSDMRSANPLHAYYHLDGNANVTALINANQALVARYLYDPFGNVLSKSGLLADANAYQFASGEVHGNSGLSYFARRFYDPTTQRWLNRDPIRELGGINLYDYVANDPINKIDPLGLWNLWAPWTWGVTTGAGTTAWNSLNPFDSSAGWSGFSLETASEADAAFLDGINPFGNPFANMGLYDPCDKALRVSRHIGSATAVTLATLGSFGTLGIVEGAGAGGSSEAVLAAIARLEAAEATLSQAELASLVAEGNLVIATDTGVGEYIAIANEASVDALWTEINAGYALQTAAEALEALGLRVGLLW